MSGTSGSAPRNLHITRDAVNDREVKRSARITRALKFCLEAFLVGLREPPPNVVQAVNERRLDL